MEPEENWFSDPDIRIMLDDLALDTQTKLMLIVPMMKPYVQPSDEWRLFLAGSAFIDFYSRARTEMGFSIDEAFSTAFNNLMQLGFVAELFENFVKNGIDRIGGN